MKNRLLTLCGVLILAFMFAGCSGHVTGREEASPTPAADPETDMISSPAPDPEPASVTQEVIDEAVRTAELHGLTTEDIHGEYSLFLDFAKKTEANEGLGRYKEMLYLIFPVIADNTEYLDCEYLLNRVSDLQMIDDEVSQGRWGEYDRGLNTVIIDTLTEEADDYHRPGTVFHELMHFLDHNAGSDSYSLYYFLDDKVLSLDEFLALTNEDQCRATSCCAPDYLFEGGAELFTAKYFSGATHSYFEACRFLSGIEHIYGPEKLKEMFFSTDSDVQAAQLFFDAGYSYERYADATASLNSLTYPDDCPAPDNYIAPEEILIDLYRSELGDGWENDSKFRYIIDSFNADWDFCEALNAKVYADLPFTPTLFRSPPVPVFRNGKMTLGSYATWTDPDTGRTVRGTINAEYDFDKEETITYELIDTEMMESGLFGKTIS